MPGWVIALIVIGILAILAIGIPVGCMVVLGGATGAMVHAEKKAQEREHQLQREEEAALVLEREKAKQRDEQINKLLMQLKDMKDESEMTAEELEAKEEMLELLSTLQEEGKD